MSINYALDQAVGPDDSWPSQPVEPTQRRLEPISLGAHGSALLGRIAADLDELGDGEGDLSTAGPAGGLSTAETPVGSASAGRAGRLGDLLGMDAVEFSELPYRQRCARLLRVAIDTESESLISLVQFALEGVVTVHVADGEYADQMRRYSIGGEIDPKCSPLPRVTLNMGALVDDIDFEAVDLCGSIAEGNFAYYGPDLVPCPSWCTKTHDAPDDSCAAHVDAVTDIEGDSLPVDIAQLRSWCSPVGEPVIWVGQTGFRPSEARDLARKLLAAAEVAGAAS